MAGCSQATVLDGHAVSMRYDPFRVAGLPTSETVPADLAAAGTHVGGGDPGAEHGRRGDPAGAALLAVQGTSKNSGRSTTRIRSRARSLRCPGWCRSMPGAGSPSAVKGQERVRLRRAVLRGAGADHLGPGRSHARRQGVLRRTDDQRADRPRVRPRFAVARGTGGRAERIQLVREQQADCMAGVYMRGSPKGIRRG